MINLTQLCYTVLAPISVTCELILIYSFCRLRQFKDHPEVMIFWQCISQIILDIHWFTGIESIKSALPDEACLILGAISVYFYYLSWDYNLLLSIEILLKVLNPHKTKYKARRYWYHAISHLTSLSIFIALIISQTNGNSIMKTCFVQRHSVYELLILLPALIHFPLCLATISYTLYISHNTYFSSYLKYHMLVVGAFSTSWVPIALVHGLCYYGFDVTVPLWFIYVINMQVAVLLGGPSGFMVFSARMMQKGLLHKVYISIFNPTKLQKTLLIQLNAPDVDTENSVPMSYSQVFDKMTESGIRDILLAIHNVLVSSKNPNISYHINRGQDFREWNFSIGYDKKKVKITQYNITTCEYIMKYFGVSYQHVINSLNVGKDIEALTSRIKSSGGRSGAFFYYTEDREFILKTITSEELGMLKSIIKSYADHITSKEGSFLSKIFGIYKVKIEKSRTFKMILMENMASRLTSPIIFDMKGSTFDRRVCTSKFGSIDEMPNGEVYKDLDFMENISHFQVSFEEHNLVISKIKRDAKLLEGFMIMDYSLIIMIEHVVSLRDSIITKTFVTTHGKYIVFIGIIDFLQAFNTRKKLESKYKKFKSHKSSTCSSIPPLPYRKRFMQMVKNVFKLESIN